MKRIESRVAAENDVDVAVDYYTVEAGEDVAQAFADALQAAYAAIEERPKAGSPRYSHHLHLPGLRCRRLGRFPYLIFYVEQDDHIDVWRVLHAQRDISASLKGDG